jgi:hypothetical protein
VASNGQRTSAVVVVNGDDVYEDLFGACLALTDIATEGGFVTSHRVGMQRFLGDDLDPAVYVLYTATGQCTAAQQNALANRVRAGAGLVALHASNLFGPDEPMFRLIGSRYASHGPLPHESTFEVKIAAGHPITDGMKDFHIRHEHYRLELAAENVTVLAHRDTPDGPEPLLYVREVGAGRICYFQLGHDMRAWDEPAVRTILRRALQWAGKTGESDAL